MRAASRWAIVIVSCVVNAFGQSRPAESRPAPGSTPPGDPAAFASVLRLCPDETESLMLVSAAGLPEALEELVTAKGDFEKNASFKALRAASVGRKAAHRGESQSVKVFELEKPMALANVLRQELYGYEKISGVACFVRHRDSEWGPLEYWVAVVEKNFLVFATRRELLKEALAGKGSGAESRFERLGWKADAVDFAAPVVVARKPVPEKNTTVPYDRLLYSFSAQTKDARLEVIAKDGSAALKHFRQVLGDYRAESRPADEDEEDDPDQHWSGWSLVELESTKGEHHVLRVKPSNGDTRWALTHQVSQIQGLGWW